ncbi:hypothetical protein EVAR_33876_1 [Eumeta japonica]|uniref:Uncharacterized protein n=1 Tax=Eumeta variegata TaxID=151549 RepID=A0A4C1WLX5_EUMVA|nr:hypothetical protein EVAR_33876_1 [Eumeta japonica]
MVCSQTGSLCCLGILLHQKKEQKKKKKRRHKVWIKNWLQERQRLSHLHLLSELIGEPQGRSLNLALVTRISRLQAALSQHEAF